MIGLGQKYKKKAKDNEAWNLGLQTETDRLINCKNNSSNKYNINTKFNERTGSTNEQISKPIKPFSQMSVKFFIDFF